jgi:hypothetical protein
MTIAVIIKQQDVVRSGAVQEVFYQGLDSGNEDIHLTLL